MSPSLSRPRAVPRRFLGVLAASALAVTGIVASAAGSNAAQSTPAASIRGAGSSNAIPGSYIVVLNGQRSQAQTRVTTQSLAASYDVKVKDQYDASIKGFSASMSEDQAK